jgi:hypothetical protein
VNDRIDWLISNGVIKHGDWEKGHDIDDFIIVYDAPPPPAAPPLPPKERID